MQKDSVHSEVLADGDLQCWRHDMDAPSWLLLTFVIGTLGNADLLVSIKWHQQSKRTFLTNMVAADILAILCIPVRHFPPSLRYCGLGLPMRIALWMSCDIATAVQLFSVVVLSAVRFQKIRDNYVSAPTSVKADGRTKNSVARNVSTPCHHVPVRSIWTLAACYSLPTAVVYIHSDDAFQDTYMTRVAMFHSLTFRLIPLLCAACLHILTEFQIRNFQGRTRLRDDNRQLVAWLIVVLAVNYVALHGWLLHAWSQHTLLTSALDTSMYSAASCIPVVVYFTATKPRPGIIQTV